MRHKFVGLSSIGLPGSVASLDATADGSVRCPATHTGAPADTGDHCDAGEQTLLENARPCQGFTHATPGTDFDRAGTQPAVDSAGDRQAGYGASPSPTPAATQPAIGRPVRVLVVDDEPGFSELAAEHLERHDGIATVIPETDPRAALDRLHERPVDCVVSDYDMPRMDGLELLETVRRDHPDLPFVILTGQRDEEIAAEAISSGVTDYFRKRSGTDQYTKLAHRITTAVGRHRAELAVATNRRRYTRLIEEATDVVSILDESGVFRYLSPAADHRLEYSAQQLVDESLFDFVHPADTDRVMDRFATVLDNPDQPVSAEFRFRQPDGSWLWIEARGRNLLHDPDIEGIVMHSRDVTDRKDREQALRESEQRFRSLFEEAFDAMVITDEEGTYREANQAACDLFELSRAQLLGRSLAEFSTDTESHDADWQGHERSDPVRGTTPVCTAEGNRRVVEFAATPHVVPGRTLLVCRDITNRDQYERTLAALHGSSRDLLAADTRVAVAESVVETLTDVLSMSVVALYDFDSAGQLTPTAVSSDTVDLASLAPLDPEPTTIVGETFLAGQSRSVGADVSTPSFDELPLSAGVVVPIDDHGVCVVGDEDSDVSDTDRELIETLMTTAATALESVERGDQLSERAAELAEQNEALEQVRQLNDTVRTIGGRIGEAHTRTEVERIVCRYLSTTEGIALVRVSGYDPENARLVPRDQVGNRRPGAYIDAISHTPGDTSEPAARALANEDPVYVPNIGEDVHEDSWRTTALAHGFRSAFSLPLSYKGISYGTLTVYAEQTDFFDEPSRSAFIDLAQKLGTVMNAVQHQNAVLSESMTELSIRFSDEKLPLYQLACQAECSLALESVTHRSGDDTVKIVRVDGSDVQTVTRIAQGVSAISDARPATEAGETPTVELQFSRKPLSDYLAEQGIRVLDSAIDPQAAVFTVSVPETTDVGDLFSNLGAEYGQPELIGKREQSTGQGRMAERYASKLTTRQQEVLRTAYADGYFESPRECAAADVAADLDISPQTFYGHVRTAERKLFAVVFDDRGE